MTNTETTPFIIAKRTGDKYTAFKFRTCNIAISTLVQIINDHLGQGSPIKDCVNWAFDQHPPADLAMLYRDLSKDQFDEIRHKKYEDRNGLEKYIAHDFILFDLDTDEILMLDGFAQFLLSGESVTQDMLKTTLFRAYSHLVELSELPYYYKEFSHKKQIVAYDNLSHTFRVVDQGRKQVHKFLVRNFEPNSSLQEFTYCGGCGKYDCFGLSCKKTDYEIYF